MSFNINTNIASLQSQDYLRQSSDFQGKTINRVTSGLRIISSGDDAAGLAIANGYRSDQAVLTQGVRNANDGLSQLQIADGGINNISKLLDRARTLATQSASGTFTGDRSVLNSEFQSVIGEIDRQAQAIGLNTNGTFAKSLAVFIGGGAASNGISATTNGSVAIDLSASTVDSKSLGLKGVQAIGVTGTDIGTGSASTKVADILTNTNNTNSQATSGFADFYFRGPGFGDASRIKVSVNLTGVSDAGSLVTAINSAISAAGNSGSQAATAFKNAAVTAGVNVDSQGRSQLTFNSSVAAFQVEAGDKTANALLGNFSTGAEGADLATTVTGAAATAAGATTFGANGAGSVVFRISGSGLSSPIDITLTTNSAETVTQAITDLSSQVANNAALKGAGISLTSATAGSSLAFTGAHGEKFTVDVTGDSQNRLGFGSFLKGNSQEFDYTSLSGSANYSTASAGTATFEFSLNGQASNTHSIALNLSGGDATAAVVTGGASAGTLNINPNNNQVNLTISGTSYQVNLTTSATSTLNSIANQINTVISGSGTATVNSSNQLVITSNTKGAAGSVQVEAGSANTVLGLTPGVTNGVSRSGADLANALNQAFAGDTALQAAGLKADFGVTSAGKLTVSSANGTNFRVDARGTTSAATVVGSASFNTAATASAATSTANSATFTITGGSNDVLRIKADAGAFQVITLTAGAARTTAQVVNDLNNQLTGITASINPSNNIVLTSNTTGVASLVTVDTIANGSTGNTLFGFGGAPGVTATVGAASANQLTITTGSNDKLSISVDGGTAQVVTLTGGGLRTAAQVVSDINGVLLTSATASADANGHISIVSASTGTGSSVTFNSITNDAYTTLGLTAGTTSGNAGDAGYGVLGATFTGNTVSAAPSSSAQIDAGGSSQSSSFAFTPVLYGSDDQTITLTANDGSGAQQSKSITLKNDDTSRTGRSIDESLSYINTQLQQSNNPTLQSIVAVKENVAGVEKIKFLSTVSSFKISVGTNANGTGFGSQGLTDASTLAAGGSTADISAQGSAVNAVTALSNAISALGKAQAVVGRGQNQFNYAINLAQSQLSNLAAAESRIRDADLASEAANLTKSQILLQAGIAALAQANSAPQQVLSLLRG
ncbi:MAG: flagellin [Bryobacteraceae bacterium]